MADDYTIPLETISLERFQAMLATKTLQPGRMILKEHMNERFEKLASIGIHNAQELLDALKTKKRLAQTAAETGLPEEYLTILRREANSYVAKPLKLNVFPGIDEDVIARLESGGIKHTKHLIDRARTQRERAELSAQLDVPDQVLLELVKLSDLARIIGVGPVFARLLVDAGVDTLASFLSQDPDALLDKVNAVIEETGQVKVSLTMKDIAYCLDTATLLPQIVEYA